jgi:hypothetical protein
VVNPKVKPEIIVIWGLVIAAVYLLYKSLLNVPGELSTSLDNAANGLIGATDNASRGLLGATINNFESAGGDNIPDAVINSTDAISSELGALWAWITGGTTYDVHSR